MDEALVPVGRLLLWFLACFNKGGDSIDDGGVAMAATTAERQLIRWAQMNCTGEVCRSQAALAAA